MKHVLPAAALVLSLVPAALALEGDLLDGNAINCPTHLKHCHFLPIEYVDATLQVEANVDADISVDDVPQLAITAQAEVVVTLTLNSSVANRTVEAEVMVQDTEEIGLTGPANQTTSVTVGSPKTLRFPFVMDQGLLPGQVVAIPVKVLAEGQSTSSYTGYQISPAPEGMGAALLWGLGGLVAGGAGGVLVGRKL